MDMEYQVCPYCGRRGAYITTTPATGEEVEKCIYCPYLRREGETFLANLNPLRPQSIRQKEVKNGNQNRYTKEGKSTHDI